MLKRRKGGKGYFGLFWLVIPGVSARGQLVSLLRACGEGKHHAGKSACQSKLAYFMLARKQRERGKVLSVPFKVIPYRHPARSHLLSFPHLPMMMSMAVVNSELGTWLNGVGSAYQTW